MTSHTTTLADLQANWHTLHDLDRGFAVDAIRRNGASNRAIAQELNCSEALLRRLLQAIQAPKADQLLSRQGLLSTNNLVRRYKNNEVNNKTQPIKYAEAHRIQTPEEGSEVICDWLKENHLHQPWSKQIVEDAERTKIKNDANNSLPNFRAPSNMLIEEIVRCVKPKEEEPTDESKISWFGKWLTRWTFFVITDSSVRDSALKLARETQNAK